MRAGACSAGLVTLLVAIVAAPVPVAADRELLVSVAVSLSPAVSELAERFEEEHPDTELSLNSGASGVLLQQALRGAPVDLLISASPEELDRLEREGLLRPNGRAPIATNRLVVLLHRDAPRIPRAEDLILPDFDRIAVGNPGTAPVGRYAGEALAWLGLERVLAPRLVRAESARQVVEYVARGEVAAALAYRSDLKLARGRVRAGPELPPESHTPILYEAGLLAGAGPAAQEFLELLLSEEGVRTLRRHGFRPPPANDR
jgi:molybdate transport system substrate-binding protein